MASGVKCHPEVQSVFEEIKMKKAHRFVIFGLVNNNREIGVVNVGPRNATFDDLKKELQAAAEEEMGRYALYDYESENKKHILVFIIWCPSQIPVKQKMIISSSKDSIKKILTGVRAELQVNDDEELTFENIEEKALKG